MLQAGPEIHRHRADLDFHLRVGNPVRKIHRHLHQHVIALITARLRIHNIILYGNNLDILLITDHLRNLINIRSKGTDHANTRNIIDIAHHIIYGGFISVLFQFLDYALRRLNTPLDMLNRIISVHMLKLVI